MIKLNGNIRCPKCDRGTIQFLVRQHDSPKIQFQISCSRCKTKVYFVLTISREKPNATQRSPVEPQSNTGDNPKSTGEEANILSDKESDSNKESKEDELKRLFGEID